MARRERRPHSDGQAQYEAVMRAVRASPGLIALGRDGRGNERFTSRDMLDTERRLEAVADRLAGQRRDGLPTTALDNAMATVGSNGLVPGPEQQTALRHITAGHGLSIAGRARDPIAAPDRTRIILTHINAEVRALNEAARAVRGHHAVAVEAARPPGHLRFGIARAQVAVAHQQVAVALQVLPPLDESFRAQERFGARLPLVPHRADGLIAAAVRRLANNLGFALQGTGKVNRTVGADRVERLARPR